METSMAVSPEPDAFRLACPSRDLFIRLAEKWTLLAIPALADGPLRFGALRRRLEGVTQKMLTQTLRKLEADGLVDRALYDEMPLRVEYSLTPKGRALLPHVAALKLWAEENF
ncbi:MAG: helix-turn-helix domain-containing protein [Pseudomonadota bacterium]